MTKCRNVDCWHSSHLEGFIYGAQHRVEFLVVWRGHEEAHSLSALLICLPLFRLLGAWKWTRGG